MGLDMYLMGDLYYGGGFNEENEEITLKRKARWEKEERVFKIDTEDIDTILLQLGYWRKANAIHKWFVDHCWKGNYDEYRGEKICVTIKQLRELKDLCEHVLELLDNEPNYEKRKEIIEKNLPMQDGFFFGFNNSEEGIDYYIDDLEDTIKIIKKALTKIKKYDLCCAYYEASW